MAYNEEVSMMLSVVPGSLTGISALMGGLSSITNVFTDVTRQIDANFGLVDTSIITATTIVAQLGLQAAQSFGEFEQGMKVAQMVSGQTAQEMDYLKQKANEFSVSYRADIDQITEGLQTLGRAGLNSASEQTEVLKNGLSTAKLEGRDLNGVLEELIQNTALLGGNLKSSSFGEDSGYVNDMLVATSMTAPITTHDVSETLKYSGGIAAAAGANIETEENKRIFEDYLGAIAAFAQKGVTGSIAGTALRAFFNKPATQDSSVTDALATIHLKPEYLWEDDEETMKPVSEQIGLIEKQMEDLNVSTMDRLQIWSKIVGGKMGQQMMKLHSEDIQEITKDIRTADSADSLAEGTFRTFQSKMKETTEQGQVAFREFGKNAAAALTPLLDIAKMILQVFSNPIASVGVFLGSLALVISGINKIRNVIKLLKEELRTAFHYFATGEHLMAYRPSTDRKANRFKRDKERFTPEALERKYPGQGELSAYRKERKVGHEEELIDAFGRDKALIYQDSEKFKKNQKTNLSYLQELSGVNSAIKGLHEHSIDKKKNFDAAIVQYLIKNDLWTDEFTETYLKTGMDLARTLKLHEEDIYGIMKKQTEEFRRTKAAVEANKSSVHSISSNVSPYDTERVWKYRELDTSAGLEVLENVRKDEIFKEASEKYPNLKRISYDRIVARQDEKIKKLRIKRGLDADTEASRGNRIYSIRRKVEDSFIEAFIKQFDEGNAPLFGMIHNDNELDYFMNLLRANGLLTGHEAFDEKIKIALSDKITKERWNAADAYVEKFLNSGENGAYIDPKSIGLLGEEAFLERTRGRPSEVDPRTLQKAFLKRAGISNIFQMIEALAPIKADIVQYGNLPSYDYMRVLFPETRFIDSQDAYRLYERAGIEGYSPFDAAAKKEKEKKEAEEAYRKKVMRNQRREVINNAIESISNEGNYWDKDSFLMGDPEGKGFLNENQMKKKVQKIYKKDPASFLGGKQSRKDIAPILFPFFADWGEKGPLSDEELDNFAKMVGMKDGLKGNRRNKIGQLNTFFGEKDIEKRTNDILLRDEYVDKLTNFIDENASLIGGKLDSIKDVLSRIAGDVQEKKQEEIADVTTPTYPNEYHKRGSEINEYFENIEKNAYTSSFPIDYHNNISEIEKAIEKELEKTRQEAEKERKKIEKRKKEHDKRMKDAYGDAYPTYDYAEERKKRKEKEKEEKKRHPIHTKPGDRDYVPSNADILYRDMVNQNRESREKATKELNDKNAFYKDNMSLLPGVGDESFRDNFYKEKPDSFLGRFKESLKNKTDSVGDGLSTAFEGIKKNLNADRTDKLLNFGKGSVANKFLNGLDMAGGPLAAFSIAIEAATLAIDLWKGLYEDFCNKLKEAGDKLTEAYSKLSSADSALERTLKEGNPDATQDDIDQMMYDTYAEMGDKMAQSLTMGEVDWLSKLGRDTETGPEYEYDEEAADGTMKETQEELTDEENYEKALKENTGALYAAANEVSTALNNYVRISQDSWWGTDGWTGWVTDQWGGLMDKLSHPETGGSTFTGNNNEFLLTQSQADENYSGYKEMAGLMMEDFKDAGGEWLTGMKTMMGEDAQELSNALGQSTKNYLGDMARFSARRGPGSLNATQNAKIQQSMKQDPKTWKKLGKELAKRDTNKKLGKDITKNQNRIKGLTEKIRSTVGKGFRESQIQRAAYIQQLQDMKQITDQAIVPIMQTNLGIAGQTLSATGQVGANTGNTVGTTGATNENAAIIAGLVAIIARQSAKAQHFDDVLAGGEDGDNDYDGTPGTAADKALYDLATKDDMNADKFYQENMKNYNSARGMYEAGFGSFGGTNKPITERGGLFSNTENDMAGGLGYVRLIEATAKMTGYGYDKISAMNTAREFGEEAKGKKLNDIFATVDKNYTQSEQFKDEIVNAYLLSNDDADSGSGGGGSGGGGSGNKDNSGTRKERVDLVLCSKKEIPKLNVNLFKKPPTFTVLNKNFKLRDVKINTEDTPKAIMSSIKNAFIDVQKRSDPKIIQDEEAEYDPKEATDGNALPSGSAKTKTDT